MGISFHNESSKDNRVITALKDPNYTWRTSQGVSQATNLPLSEVQGIINKREFWISQTDQAARRACSSRCRPGFLS